MIVAFVVAYLVLFRIFAGSRGAGLRHRRRHAARRRRCASSRTRWQSRSARSISLLGVADGARHQRPLTALLGAVGVLRRGGREDASRVQSSSPPSAKRIAGIVDLTDRMGRVEPRKTTVRVNEIAQRIARAHAVADVRFAAGDPECDADRELLESALENVVRNAIEATGTADAVRVETERDLPGGAIVFRVVDRGPGLDARQLERAFEDFFTTKPEGTGLGLPFVRRVLLAHGGDVAMKSERAPGPGQGTTVELRLPTR
jgi:signal transduction histidine kinase